MDNIIKFPKKNSRQEEMTDVVKNISQLSDMMIEETFEMLSISFMNHMDMAGFDISKDEDTYKTFCFLMETLRSFVLKYYGKEHMFHELADNCIELEGENVIYKHIKFNFVDPLKMAEGITEKELEELEKFIDMLESDKKE